MYLFLYKTLLTLMLFVVTNIYATEKEAVCETLLNVIDINSNAYKNCLLQKSGDKFSREELNNCKKYYLTEIERLSYVYKNICNNTN